MTYGELAQARSISVASANRLEVAFGGVPSFGDLGQMGAGALDGPSQSIDLALSVCPLQVCLAQSLARLRQAGPPFRLSRRGALRSGLPIC
jgi:hypothetical protein